MSFSSIVLIKKRVSPIFVRYITPKKLLFKQFLVFGITISLMILARPQNSVPTQKRLSKSLITTQNLP